MGYDVHITRQHDFFYEDVSRNIGEEDWKAIVEADTEMKLEGRVAVSLPFGRELVYENPLLALWSGHPNNISVPFDFRDGNIVVKNPDEVILGKMKALAFLLEARVQGDDGEFYDLES